MTLAVDTERLELWPPKTEATYEALGSTLRFTAGKTSDFQDLTKAVEIFQQTQAILQGKLSYIQPRVVLILNQNV